MNNLNNDYQVIMLIADRATKLAQRLGVEYPMQDAMMDVTAAHTIRPLRLRELLAADEANFAHDVFGIRRHLNRETGRMNPLCFVPRYTAAEVKP